MKTTFVVSCLVVLGCGSSSDGGGPAPDGGLGGIGPGGTGGSAGATGGSAGATGSGGSAGSVGCATPADCPDPSKPVCDPDGTCVAGPEVPVSSECLDTLGCGSGAAFFTCAYASCPDEFAACFETGGICASFVACLANCSSCDQACYEGCSGQVDGNCAVSCMAAVTGDLQACTSGKCEPC